MTSQKTNIPRLQSGEQIILQSRAAYKDSFRSRWRVAQCFLTNQRFIIYQRQTIRFEIPLEDIEGLLVEKLYYILRKRDALCIAYKAGKNSGEGGIWFVANNLQDWRERIAGEAFKRIRECRGLGREWTN